MKKYINLFLRSFFTSIVKKTALQSGLHLKVNRYSKVTSNTILGDNVNFNGIKISGKAKVIIGDNFHSGEGCYIISSNHNYDKGSKIPYDKTYLSRDVTIEDNDLDKQVSYTYANGTRIRNNRFSAVIPNSGYAIYASGNGTTVYNNEISGNDIKNYGIGMIVESKGVKVFDNDIYNSTNGLQIGRCENSEFYNNNINVDQKGINIANTFVDNIDIHNNTVSSNRFLFYSVRVNSKEEYKDYKLTVRDNIFNNSKKVTIASSNGLTFSNNDVNGGLEIGSSSNIVIANNIIKPTSFDGIRLYNNHDNVSILNNTIYNPTGAARFQCINNKTTSNLEFISISGNTCN